MPNQVVVPFSPRPHRERVRLSRLVTQPRRAKIRAQLSTARGVLQAVIEMLSYAGDARVKRPLLAAPSLPHTK